MSDSQTLAQCLAGGPVPPSEALECAVQVGDTLRHLHDEGRVHGELTPDTVLLTPAGIRLLPGEAGKPKITPYTAPERIRGHPPDAHADIFSFGAILYEMFTGRAPFGGNTPEALADSVCNFTPPPIGHPRLDRLVGTCLSKDRAGRWQRMQQAVIELKLLAGAERRSGSVGVGGQTKIEAILRAEMRQIETRLTTIVGDQRRRLQQASDLMDALRAQVGELAGQNGAEQDRLARIEDLVEKIYGEAVGQQGVLDRLQHLEQTVNTQSAAIERACNGVARTDDLVESVVEALESLQALVLERGDEHAPGSR